jgi:hypothetical protein
MTKHTDLITVAECDNFEEKLSNFDFEFSEKLTILPSNFDSAKSRSELQNVAEVSTVKKLLRSKDIEVIDLLESDKKKYVHNYDWEWVAPTFYIANLLQESAVNVMLGVVANYVTDFLKGKTGNKVKFEFVVKRTAKTLYSKITYSGPIDNFRIEEVTNKILKEMKK